MTTILKAATPADLLRHIPHLLGFPPRDSLVLLPFEGSRSLGVMRVDLPHDDDDGGGDDDGDRLAATIIGMACRVSSVDGVALVVYTDGPSMAAAPPHRAFADALLSRAAACGLSIVDALCVSAGAWASYGDERVEWRPLPHDPELAALSDDHLGDTAPSPASAVDRAAVAAALDAIADAVAALRAPAGGPARDARVDPRAIAAVCGLDDLPAAFEAALEWNPASLAPFPAAALAWCLSLSGLRDVALVQWCRGFAAGDEALEAQLRWAAGEEYPTHLAQIMWGDGERPDARRLVKALAVLRAVASACPPEFRAPPLAFAAWISWALGRSTHAHRYAVQACEIDPENTLAEIVGSFVTVGHLPDWAFRPHPA